MGGGLGYNGLNLFYETIRLGKEPYSPKTIENFFNVRLPLEFIIEFPPVLIAIAIDR